MSEVVAQIKVMPKDADIKISEQEFKKVLPEQTKIIAIQKEEVAFGLEATLLKVELPDKEGGTTKIEEAFKKIQGVGEVEVQGVSRV